MPSFLVICIREFLESHKSLKVVIQEEGTCQWVDGRPLYLPGSNPKCYALKHPGAQAKGVTPSPPILMHLKEQTFHSGETLKFKLAKNHAKEAAGQFPFDCHV